MAVACGCTVLALAGGGVPAPALAARPRPPRSRQVNVVITGSLGVVWSGDPARGCAAAGLCAVRGSLDMVQEEGASASSNGVPPLEMSDPSAVARVQSTAPDGTVTSCADLVPIDFFLTVRQTTAGPRATIDPAGSPASPSAGRCAGPTAADLGAMDLPVRRLGARGYDVSGRSSFTAGPFEVTAIATVRIRFTYGSQGASGGTVTGGSSTPVPPQHRRSVFQESAAVRYRVTGVSGALDTDFSGLAPPLCDGLGACGASGRLVQTMSTRGSVVFAGSRLVGHRVGRDGALADLRGGRLPLFDTFGSRPIRERVSETTLRGDGESCTDTGSLELPTAPFTRVRPGIDELTLPAGAGEFGPGSIDPFRTRCPGPSAQDIVGTGGAIARATVTTGKLGDRRLTIIFRPRSTFSGWAYSGRRTGSVVVSLARTRESGGSRRVMRFAGGPVVPPT